MHVSFKLISSFSCELLDVLHTWSIIWDPVRSGFDPKQLKEKVKIKYSYKLREIWHFLVRVWRRHWFDNTTQFNCIRNHLKIFTEAVQDVCTRRWIADVGSHTFLGQTFDNCKWWPDSVFTVSKWASLKRGLETVQKQLGCQKRGTFMGHLIETGASATSKAR